MMYYFIKDGENELGPFTLNQLKSRAIQKNTLIWFAGLEEWTFAGQVYELKGLFVVKALPEPSPKTKTNKFWEPKLLKQQLRKASYQFIVVRARKNLY